ncbi:hypothetical protein GCM10025858_03630 [Alicyclobacillus sacchari]|nr:hypothetical protein [Alicyclobacillus sacchari]GMA55860.1 hypothetical protein GCM10025858_03630 [Alicyclobacillus sacchari]
MRRIVVMLCACVVCCLLTWIVPATNASADTAAPSLTQAEAQAQNAIQQAAQTQLDHLPTQTIDEYWQDLLNEYGGYLPNVSGPGLVKSVLQNGPPNFASVTHGLIRYFFQELVDDAGLLGSILILCVAGAVLKTLQTSFEQESISELADMVVCFVLIALVAHSFVETIGAARHAIETMNHFMLATVPLTVTLLAASGSIASAAFFQPMLLFTVHFVSNMVFYVVFPLIFFAAVLDLTSALSIRYTLTRLAGLIRTVSVAILSFGLAVFIGISTVQGA